MPKKIKLSAVKEELQSYADALDEVNTVEESPPQEAVSSDEPPPVEEIPQPEKKEKAMGTCEACGKTMTMKNLKYAHKLICPAIDRTEPESDEEPVDEEPEPPKPKTRKPRVKKVEVEVEATSSFEPPKRTISRSYADAARDVVAKPEPEPEVVKPKPKRKPKTAKVDDLEDLVEEQSAELLKVEPKVVPKKSRSVRKVELYEKLAADALP